MDIRHSVLGTPHRKVLANHRHEETEAPQGLKGSGERSLATVKRSLLLPLSQENLITFTHSTCISFCSRRYGIFYQHNR